MIRRSWRWFWLLPALLLLGLVALGVFAYTTVPAPLVEQVEAQARSYYLERSIGGPWDRIHSLDVGGHFTLARTGPELLNWEPAWCLGVDAQGQRGGRPVSEHSEWMGWTSGGDWAVGRINVPWSSLHAPACN